MQSFGTAGEISANHPFSFSFKCAIIRKITDGGIDMPRTSNKAELIMAFVNDFIQENGFAPSVREIGAAVG